MKTAEKLPRSLKVKVAAYGRYSCDLQSALSAEDQINRIKHCIKNGLIPGKDAADLELVSEWTIKDEAQSSKTVGRAGFEKIQRGIRERSFDLLLVDDLSRLTRDLGNLLSLYELLKWYGVELYSICDRVNSKDPNAKMFFTMRGMVNDFSNEIHAERVIRGMEMRALQGFSTGHCPFGYKSEPTQMQNARGKPHPSHYKIHIDEEEAQVVRRIFNMYRMGLGAVRIAKTLNEEKVPVPKMKGRNANINDGWAPRSIQKFLENEKYAGIWRWRKTRVGIHPESKKRIARIRPMHEWVLFNDQLVNEELRIVEQSVFEEVKKIQKRNKDVLDQLGSSRRWANPKKQLPDHPFSGLLECGSCGSNFILISGKDGGYYGCMSAHRKGICIQKQLINIKKIETGMFQMISEKLNDPNVIDFATEQYKRAMLSLLKGSPGKLKIMEKEIAKFNQEKDNLILFIAQGKASESINEAVRERENKIAHLENEIRTLRQAQPQVREITKDQISQRIKLLSKTVTEHATALMPVIRKMFPKKVKVLDEGQLAASRNQHRNTFSLSGAIYLNNGLGERFERLVPTKNKKGEDANLPPNVLLFPKKFKNLPQCDAKVSEFDTLANR